MVNAIFFQSRWQKKEKSINSNATARIFWVVCVPGLCVKVRLEPTFRWCKAETVWIFPRNQSLEDRCSWNDDPRYLSDDCIAIPIKFVNVICAITAKRSAKTSATSRSEFLFSLLNLLLLFFSRFRLLCPGCSSSLVALPNKTIVYMRWFRWKNDDLMKNAFY